MNDLDVHLSAIVSGDPEAFGRWVAGCELRLRRSLASFAGSVDVEAVLQETLLRVWQVAPRLEPDGNPVGSQFQVNNTTTGSQSSPSASVSADGQITVVWQSQGSAGTDVSEESIQGQSYRYPVFADGFESGDTSSWSSTVPAR